MGAVARGLELELAHFGPGLLFSLVCGKVVIYSPMGVFKVHTRRLGALLGRPSWERTKEVLAALGMMDSGDVASFPLVQGSGGQSSSLLMWQNFVWNL